MTVPGDAVLGHDAIRPEGAKLQRDGKKLCDGRATVERSNGGAGNDHGGRTTTIVSADKNFHDADTVLVEIESRKGASGARGSRRRTRSRPAAAGQSDGRGRRVTRAGVRQFDVRHAAASNDCGRGSPRA